MNTKVNWDTLGIATSVACAIHCALLPVLFTSLPVFGINIVHNSFFEWGMIAFAFFVGAYSLIHGYYKHHRNLLPLSIFTFGFCFLILKQIFHDHENYFLPFAVASIIYAHYRNFRMCHFSKCNSQHHKH